MQYLQRVCGACCAMCLPCVLCLWKFWGRLNHSWTPATCYCWVNCSAALTINAFEMNSHAVGKCFQQVQFLILLSFKCKLSVSTCILNQPVPYHLLHGRRPDMLSIVEIHLRWCKATRGRRWPRPRGNFPLNPKYICTAKLTKWITVRWHTSGMLCGVRRSTCRGHPSWLIHCNYTTNTLHIHSVLFCPVFSRARLLWPGLSPFFQQANTWFK